MYINIRSSLYDNTVVVNQTQNEEISNKLMDTSLQAQSASLPLGPSFFFVVSIYIIMVLFFFIYNILANTAKLCGLIQ
ncbi:hypothetical protein BDB00DRAFT_863680 [Zychaea mexicana]|uniref:uncharacterized protein n=1 Tax=Zychaea mexicana TaxID=64656 RepID=UPI0022FE2661|nr:uncharacterized protein BDB00DRAFT_863680 [Zychaea mexicana]KAI9468666.1 hypothetical protein BDB00DRAFT_863680 [Zychaea mexicana]